MPIESFIDTHQHLLYPDRFRYGWVDGVPTLQGDFPLERYRAESEGCGIGGTIFMEVDVDEEDAGDEARFFCKLAEDADNRILGVVAAARPEHEGFEAYLDLISHPRLKGIRRVLHTQPDDLSRSSRFRDSVGRLGERGLTFDLCVLQRQLAIALELVASCPETTFILDHCGGPDIAAHGTPEGAGFSEWAEGILALSAHDNVNCKISGITTCARVDQRTPDVLRPYVGTALDAFGPNRCVWGGDWPVCNLAAGLSVWCQLAEQCCVSMSKAAHSALFTENAVRIYHLNT